ncbi:MAG: ester cyclase, partial [Dehalococcoidia bacterium]|nr:ester cyclase [Dehalococcoidia bacterium]
VDQVTAEGDRVVLQITVTGTHKGTFLGIPATGRAISYPSMVTYRIRDGKIAETRAVFDQLALLRQIGAERLPD